MTRAWVVKQLAQEAREVVRELNPEGYQNMERVRWEAAKKAFDRAAELMASIERDMDLEPLTAGWSVKTKAARDDFLRRVLGGELADKVLAAATKEGVSVTVTPRPAGGQKAQQPSSSPVAGYISDLARKPATEAQAAEVEKALQQSAEDPFTRSASAYVADFLRHGGVQG